MTDTNPPASSPEIIIRLAGPEDMLACAQLNASFTTDYVRQMSYFTDEREVRVSFSRIRLPRTMAVEASYTEAERFKILHDVHFLLVATYQDMVVGCVGGMLEDWHQRVLLTIFTVHPQARREGVGRQLFYAVKGMAQEADYRQIMTMVQTKNHPAITFAEKTGFRLCGYHDQHYANGDIALSFMLTL